MSANNGFDYRGKVVAVIGGTSGINRGIAEAFARAGAHVAVASRSQQKVDATLAALAPLGQGDVHGFAADVRDLSALQTGISGAAQALGAFDVVVSGAAGNFPALADDLSANGFKSVMDIDVLGSFHVLKCVREQLRPEGASIIHISAPQAFVAMPLQSHVCAAKAGVDMLTRSLALEWGADNIRINSVVPGPIQGTEGMNRLAPSPQMQEFVRNSVPLKRLGNCEDVANLCLFLGSPWASYITGAVIPADGGWSLSGVSSCGDAILSMMREQGSAYKQRDSQESKEESKGEDNKAGGH